VPAAQLAPVIAVPELLAPAQVATQWAVPSRPVRFAPGDPLAVPVADAH
jgi:hypothetical protein